MIGLIFSKLDKFPYALAPTPEPDFPWWHDPEEFEGDFE